MSQDHSTHSQDLLTTFFSGCETLFRFLEERHGYNFYSGLATYVGGRQIIRPYNHENVKPPFFAVTRYELDDTAIEIIYGDANFSFDIFFCPDRVNRFTMSELLTAAKKLHGAPGKAQLLTNTSILSDVMRSQAELFEKHERTLIALDEAIITKAVSQRAKGMEKKIRDQFRRNLKFSIRQAARAFAEDNYKMVVTLLMPYEHYLKKSDLRKLEIARQSLIN